MSYGLKYSIPFSSVSSRNLTVKFLFDGYSGPSIDLVGGAAPSVRETKADSILEAIRGIQGTFSYIDDGGTPVTEFISEYDEQIKVILYDSDNSIDLWTGFVVPDGCSEDFLPTPKSATVKATDNLGRLKTLEFLDLNNERIYSKYKITEYLNVILRKTGLELPVNIFVNLFEDGMDNRGVATNKDPFAQTKIHTRSFIKDGVVYEDCWSVLNKILEAWQCSLFQYNSEWYIVRWLELRQFNNLIPGTRYDYDLTNPTAVTLPAALAIGFEENLKLVNANAVKSTVQGYKYSKLTYKYEQPHKLIRNDDLKLLGTFINSITSGGIRYDSYNLPYWNLLGSPTPYLVIEYDATLLNEIHRYAYLPWYSEIQTESIEVNGGDRFEITFNHRTIADVSDAYLPYVRVQLEVGATTYYLQVRSQITTLNKRDILEWATSYDPSKIPTDFIYSSDDSSTWRNYSLSAIQPPDYTKDKTILIPHDGTMKIIFGAVFVSSSYSDIQVKDFRIEYYTFLNGSTKVQGQYHKEERTGIIKNNSEAEIFIDDSPKNNIKGVMFLTDGTTKTSSWGGDKFGNVTAKDLMQLNSKNRVRIEGEIKGIAGLKNVFNINDLPDKNFALASATINDREEITNVLLQEIYEGAEADVTLTDTFEYILDV